MLFDAEVLAPTLEGVICELLPIIRNDNLGNPKRQTIFFQKNVWTVKPIMLLRGSALTHFVK